MRQSEAAARGEGRCDLYRWCRRQGMPQLRQTQSLRARESKIRRSSTRLAVYTATAATDARAGDGGALRLATYGRLVHHRHHRRSSRRSST